MKVEKALASAAFTLLVSSFSHAADTYKIDPAHTSITFSVRHLGINSVRGRFNEFAGAIVVDRGTMTEATGTIEVKSVDTGVQKRDDHLRSPDFFDVAKYPTITFNLKRVKKTPLFTRHKMPNGRITITGDFTMHGVTKELQLPARLMGRPKTRGGTSGLAWKPRPS